LRPPFQYTPLQRALKPRNSTLFNISPRVAINVYSLFPYLTIGQNKYPLKQGYYDNFGNGTIDSDKWTTTRTFQGNSSYIISDYITEASNKITCETYLSGIDANGWNSLLRKLISVNFRKGIDVSFDIYYDVKVSKGASDDGQWTADVAFFGPGSCSWMKSLDSNQGNNEITGTTTIDLNWVGNTLRMKASDEGTVRTATVSGTFLSFYFEASSDNINYTGTAYSNSSSRVAKAHYELSNFRIRDSATRI